VQREQSHFLREEIISLLRKEAISIVLPEEEAAGFYSRYFLVPKKDGNYRPILDLRVLNKTLMLLRFRMLTPRRLVQFIRPNDWFITIDRSPAGDVAHAAFPNVVPVSETQRSQKQILQNNGVLQMQESPGNLESPLVPRGVGHYGHSVASRSSDHRRFHQRRGSCLRRERRERSLVCDRGRVSHKCVRAANSSPSSTTFSAQAEWSACTSEDGQHCDLGV